MLLGVDGGGTKTDVAVAGRDGTVLATARVGCTNHEAVGLDAAVDELHAGVRAVLRDAGVAPDRVVAAVFGLAGVDWPSDEVAIAGALGRFGLGGRLAVVNDSHVALRAGAPSGWGVVSAVGTGSVTAGVDRAGRWFRTMSVGWGEPCGASSLVADALHAVAAAHHRTGPPTSLTERVLEACGASDVAGLFERISRSSWRPGPALAPVVQRAADDDGDAVAAALLSRSGEQHAAMVVGVADHLGLRDDAFELVLAGSVHASGGRFGAAFAAAVRTGCPSVAPVALVRPAVEGAVLMAADLAAAGT